ncbi:MAG TPA: hypothetical protein VFH41_01080 [Bradyrhizobium sp.]|nr:hypothetical protein [Bradyrhizobium sp.]
MESADAPLYTTGGKSGNQQLRRRNRLHPQKMQGFEYDPARNDHVEGEVKTGLPASNPKR